MTQEAYPRGTVVLVPFPFTDLSGRKRRPALVVSPGETGSDGEDLILCAITSRIPRARFRWDVVLEAEDVAEKALPKRSLVKAGKIFTMHRNLIAARFGMVKESKLREVLDGLRELFAPASGDAGRDAPGAETEIRVGEVDGAVLALLHLNAFSEKYGWRAWKTLDRDAMDRLHERGLISDPKSKAKSVVLTEEGRALAEEAFRQKFAQP